MAGDARERPGALRRRSRPLAGPPPSPSRRRRPATTSSATATASSTRPPSAASPTRPRCSSITRATISAPRLTHTIEVAQLARALAKALRLDEELAEAVALGHDLGHTPFGHTGEDALDACMAAYGGFDHNSHGLRLVTELERRYADFDGLNLTWETLEGLVKHNGPLLDADRPAARALARARRSRRDPRLRPPPGPRSRPIRQPRGAGGGARRRHRLRRPRHRRRPARRAVHARRDPRAVPFVAALLAEIERLHPGLERPRVIHELTRRVITRFIEDAIAESRAAHRRRRGRQPRRRSHARAGRSSASRRRSRRPTATSRRSCSPTCTAIPTCRSGARARPTRSCGACSRPISPTPVDAAGLGGQGRRARRRARRAPSPTTSPA